MMCNKCSKDQPESEFRLYRKSSKVYRYRICKSCENSYAKEYRTNHVDQIKKAHRNWNIAHKEYKMEYRATHPEYVQRQQEHEKERRKSDRVKQMRIVWENNRRARKIGNGVVTQDEWNAVLEFYGYKCLRCKRTDVPLTQDHVMPLKLGGKHSISNLQPLCRSCNSIKQAKYIDYREGSLLSDYREVDINF